MILKIGQRKLSSLREKNTEKLTEPQRTVDHQMYQEKEAEKLLKNIMDKILPNLIKKKKNSITCSFSPRVVRGR